MQKVRITTRALIQRINRKLADDRQVLKRTRGTQAQLDLGDYFVLDLANNAVIRKNVEPLVLAKTLKVLQPFESVADE